MELDGIFFFDILNNAEAGWTAVFGVGLKVKWEVSPINRC